MTTLYRILASVARDNGAAQPTDHPFEEPQR